MTTYPKIETLFNRFPKGHPQAFKVDTTQVRCPEFAAIRSWIITEKIDGTNIRVRYEPPTGRVSFYGRTDRAQLPTFLSAHLAKTFRTNPGLAAAFPPSEFENGD